MVNVSELINENNNSREKTKAPNVIGVEILKKNGLNVDKLIKEYKKLKRKEKSNLNQVKLLDKYGKPL